MLALPVALVLLFALCVGTQDEPDKETVKQPSTTAAAATEETKARASTTLYALPTLYEETPSSILRSEETTTLRITTTKKATTTTFSSSKGCTKCRNSNLSCGEIARENGTDVICTCIKPFPNGEYSSCYLSRGVICTACHDKTVCGQNNAKGELCRCDEEVGPGMYLACFLGKPKCTKCADGTPCGDVNKTGSGCFCKPACHGPGCEYDTCDLRAQGS